MSSGLPFSHRLPTFLLGTGMMALGAAVLFNLRPPSLSFTQLMAFASVGCGCLWLLLGCLQRRGGFWVMFRLGNANALVLVAVVALLESGARALHVDFSKLSRQSAAEQREAYPIFAREPDRPLPEIYFQHPGPDSWTGQPLRTLERLRMGTDNAYANEPSITVTYDNQGFRNPADLSDWDVAIVGDSYTEQGYLPIDQVSSSVVAARTGKRVKNVGACDSGLLSYARYLSRFGKAASTSSVAFVMFEGNDVQDTTMEFEALQHFKQTGERPFKESGPQPSFIKAVVSAVSGFRNRPMPQSYQNAWYTKNAGDPLPITISTELPVNPLEASDVQLTAMREAVRACATEARNLGLAPLLVYVPVNNRVYHGMLKFSDKLPDEVRRWQPHGLPEFMNNLCRENGISFVDTTPALRSSAEKGVFVHNRILDCHVNTEGARIIGEVIAEALGATVKPAQVAAQPTR